MDDLISRAVLNNAIEQEYDGVCVYDVSGSQAISDFQTIVDIQPAVDAVPVVHGRWIDENPNDSLDPRMRCSVCKEIETPLIKWRYCPNCGAKMEENE